MIYRRFVQFSLALVALVCGLGTLSSLTASSAQTPSPALPICFVLALGFSALLTDPIPPGDHGRV